MQKYGRRLAPPHTASHSLPVCEYTVFLECLWAGQGWCCSQATTAYPLDYFPRKVSSSNSWISLGSAVSPAETGRSAWPELPRPQKQGEALGQVVFPISASLGRAKALRSHTKYSTVPLLCL